MAIRTDHAHTDTHVPMFRPYRALGLMVVGPRVTLRCTLGFDVTSLQDL
jgi:hypothetical protein